VSVGKSREKGEKAQPVVQKEALFECTDYGVLQQLVGETDAHLKKLEKSIGISILRDPKGLKLSGRDDGVSLALDLLEQLRGIIQGGETLFPGDVERALQIVSSNRSSRLEELFRDQVRIPGRRRSIIPKTFTQKQYLDAIREFDLIFGIGPAGTGKTYLAMAMAVCALTNKDVKRIVLCRPAVEAGEKLGFLPGDMAEKVNPYLRPLYDALHDMVDYERAQEMMEKGMIEVAPLAFMRGRTLSNAMVILDEAQNTTSAQMKMLLTRIGFGSKCIITGDPTQVDLPRGITSGLVEALNVLSRIDDIAIVNFTDQDVVRHPLVAKIVRAYEAKESREM